jgi:hypothetical protein
MPARKTNAPTTYKRPEIMRNGSPAGAIDALKPSSGGDFYPFPAGSTTPVTFA